MKNNQIINSLLTILLAVSLLVAFNYYKNKDLVSDTENRNPIGSTTQTFGLNLDTDIYKNIKCDSAAMNYNNRSVNWNSFCNSIENGVHTDLIWRRSNMEPKEVAQEYAISVVNKRREMGMSYENGKIHCEDVENYEKKTNITAYKSECTITTGKDKTYLSLLFLYPSEAAKLNISNLLAVAGTDKDAVDAKISTLERGISAKPKTLSFLNIFERAYAAQQGGTGNYNNDVPWGRIWLSPDTCYIPVGGTSCSVTVNWDSSYSGNPSAFVGNNEFDAQDPSAGGILFEGQSGSVLTYFSYWAPNANQRLALYAPNDDTLSDVYVHTTCASNSTWNGTMCASNNQNQNNCANGAMNSPECNLCAPGYTYYQSQQWCVQGPTCSGGITGFANEAALPAHTEKTSPWCGTGSYTYGPYPTGPNNYSWTCASYYNANDIKQCEVFPFVPAPTSTPSSSTIIDRFVVNPTEVSCGGGKVTVSWYIQHGAGKSCVLTATTTKPISAYSTSTQSARASDIAAINAYLGTLKYDSKVDADSGYNKSQEYSFNTESVQNKSLAEIIKVGLNYSTKFTVTCGDATASEEVAVACSGDY